MSKRGVAAVARIMESMQSVRIALLGGDYGRNDNKPDTQDVLLAQILEDGKVAMAEKFAAATVTAPVKKKVKRHPRLINPEKKPKPKVKEDPEVQEALDIVDQISTTIDDVNEDTRDKNSGFFDDVEKKSADIGKTIETTGRVSEAQMTALENMLSGVQKWVR